MGRQRKSIGGCDDAFMEEFMTPQTRAEMEADQRMMAKEEKRHEQAGRAADAVVCSVRAKAPSWLSGCSEQWEAMMVGVQREVHMDIHLGFSVPWNQSLQSMFVAVMEAQILCEMDRGTTYGELGEMVSVLDRSWLSDGSNDALDRMLGSKSHRSVKMEGVDYLEKTFAISQARKHAHACEGRGQMHALIAAGRAWRERVELGLAAGPAGSSTPGPRV